MAELVRASDYLKSLETGTPISPVSPSRSPAPSPMMSPAPTPFVPQQIIAPKPTPFVPPNLRNAQPGRVQKTAPFNLATVPLTPMGAPITPADLAGMPSRAQQERERPWEGIEQNENFSIVAQERAALPGANFSAPWEGRAASAELSLKRMESRDPDYQQKSFNDVPNATMHYFMTQEEINKLYYLLGTGERRAADDFMKDLNTQLNERYASYIEGVVSETARENPALGALGTVAAGAFTPLAAAETWRQNAANVMTGRDDPVDISSPMFLGARIEAAGRGSVMEAAADMPFFGEQEILGQNVGQFLAGTGLSIGQTALRGIMGGGGKANLALAGSGATGQKALDMLKAGEASNAEVLVLSTALGVIEAATEKIPLDNLMGMINSGGGKNVVRAIFQQMGIEAAEEAVAEVAGNIADILVLGDRSEFEQTKRNMMQSGMSEAEAENAAFQQVFVNNTALSALGGALSGGVLGAGANLIGNVAGNQAGNTSVDVANNQTVADAAPSAQAESTAINTNPTQQAMPENTVIADTSLFEPSILSNFNEARKKVIAFAKENFPSFVTNKETGNMIGISRIGMDKLLSGSISPQKYASAFHVPQLIENALFLDAASNYHPETANDFPTFSYYESPISVDGESYMAHIRVKNTSMGDRYYGHTLSEIDEIKIEPSARSALVDKPPATLVHANEDSTVIGAGTQDVSTPASVTNIPQSPTSVNPQNMGQSQPNDVFVQDLRRRGIIPPEQTSHAEGGDSVGATRPISEEGINATYQERLETTGPMPAGENPWRQPQIPNRDINDGNISRSVRTVTEAQATPNEAVSPIVEAAVDGQLSVMNITNDDASNRARDEIKEKGYIDSLVIWENDISKGRVSADLMAMGAHLYNNAVNTGDMKTAVEILVNYAALNTNAAQALQAARILKTLSPENSLYAFDAAVRQIERAANRQYGDRLGQDAITGKDITIKVDPAIAQEYALAQDDAGRDAALKKAYENIASQIPATFGDKWNAWRYLAMLGNPRTHIRNIIGNVGFVPMRQTRNAISAGAEGVMSRFLPNMERTRSVLNPLDGADRSLWNAARSDAANVQSELLGEGKYQERFGAIENARTIFNNRVLEAARRGNSNLLELEDAFFSQRAYADALGGYLKANGIDAQSLTNGTVNAELLDRARAFAIKEAQEATYRDSNAFSDAIARRPKNKVFRVLTDAVLPFRKTPANLVMRGIEYSPVGLVKGIYDGLTQVSNGDMTANQVIDEISAGLTGTGVLALGAFLRSMGILVGGGTGDDEQDEMNRLQGVQDYALQIGDTTYTLDWLAPASMPLFVGVALYDTMTGENGGMSPGKAFDAMLDIADPMVEMSMLQSLEEILDNVSYEDNKIGYVLGTAAASYISQAVPTVLGQVARTMDGGDRRGYIQSDSDMPRFFETAVQRTGRRIPFVSANYERHVDAWGRTAPEQSVPTRAILNTLSPGFLSTITTTAADEEIQRLYDSIGATLTPSSPAKSYKLGDQTYYLTAPEFSRFSITKGQTSLEAVEALMQTDYYHGLPDDEKAKTIEKAYELATYIAKREFFERRNIEYSNSTWDKSLPALEAGVSPATLIEYKGMLTDTSTATKTNVWAQAQGDSSLNTAQREALNDTINFQSDKFLGAWPEVQALGLSADDYARAWQINGMNSEELGALVLEAGLAREQVVRNLVAAKDAAELKRKLLLDMGMDRATVNRLLRLI